MGEAIDEISVVSGGDINDSYTINVGHSKYFLKTNRESSGKAILKSEWHGLELLSENHAPTPSIIIDGTDSGTPFLLMEYIPSSSLQNEEQVAIALSQLHRNRSKVFGLDGNNFIGSLKQSNTPNSDLFEFVIQARFMPQIDLAIRKGYLIDLNTDSFFQNLEQLIPGSPATLVHGDLWGGNMVVKSGKPVFIDPSVAYSHPGFDLGMMRLFGGFSAKVFDAYLDLNPSIKDTYEVLDVFQLYYLLVHLNIFGSSYVSQCREIIRKYS